mgnify:CR=1 FL=1
MKKLFIILGALLFIIMLYLFMSNIIIPLIFTEGSIGIGGEKLYGEKLTEVIQVAKKIILLPCVIFLTAVFQILIGCQDTENKD